MSRLSATKTAMTAEAERSSSLVSLIDSPPTFGASRDNSCVTLRNHCLRLSLTIISAVLRARGCLERSFYKYRAFPCVAAFLDHPRRVVLLKAPRNNGKLLIGITDLNTKRSENVRVVLTLDESSLTNREIIFNL